MDIVISPKVDVNNGYAVFDDAGEYKVTYTIKDSKDNVTIKQTDITVIGREVYLDFSYSNGFYTSISSKSEALFLVIKFNIGFGLWRVWTNSKIWVKFSW